MIDKGLYRAARSRLLTDIAGIDPSRTDVLELVDWLNETIRKQEEEQDGPS